MNEILKQSQTVQSWKNCRPFLGKSFYLSESDIKDAIKIAEVIGNGLIDKLRKYLWLY